MRVSTLITHLRPEEAHTLIQCLDQLRDALLKTYGEDIRAMMQEAAASHEASNADDDQVPF